MQCFWFLNLLYLWTYFKNALTCPIEKQTLIHRPDLFLWLVPDPMSVAAVVAVAAMSAMS